VTGCRGGESGHCEETDVCRSMRRGRREEEGENEEEVDEEI
jgi:hypothetical protein